MPPTPIPAPTTPYPPPPPPPGQNHRQDDQQGHDDEQLPDAPPQCRPLHHHHRQRRGEDNGDEEEEEDDSPEAPSTATVDTYRTVTTNTDSSDDTPDTDDSGGFDGKKTVDDTPDTDDSVGPNIKAGINSNATNTDTTTADITDETPPSASVPESTSAATFKSISVEPSTGLTTPSPRSTRTSTHSAGAATPGPGYSNHYSPRVVYGPSAVTRLPTELGRLHLVSPLIVSSPSRISLARRIQALIPNLDSRILDSALINVPQHVVDDAVSRITGRDCVISVGGTSAVGLAKAIATRKDIPHVCIPTTYSGSELPSQDQARRLERMETRRRRSASTSMSPNGPDGPSNSSTGGSKSPNSSKSPGGSSSKGRRERTANARPSIIIYDEDLTAADSHTHFPVPHEARTPIVPRHRFPEEEENAQWSYIHLPGV